MYVQTWSLTSDRLRGHWHGGLEATTADTFEHMPGAPAYVLLCKKQSGNKQLARINYH